MWLKACQLLKVSRSGNIQCKDYWNSVALRYNRVLKACQSSLLRSGINWSVKLSMASSSPPSHLCQLTAAKSAQENSIRPTCSGNISLGGQRESRSSSCPAPAHSTHNTEDSHGLLRFSNPPKISPGNPSQATRQSPNKWLSSVLK